jgi:hypothetical protein
MKENSTVQVWEKISKRMHFSLIFLMILWLVSGSQKGTLPDVTEIRSDMFQSPVQEETDEDDFSFYYRNTQYDVTPLYDYELWGVVVTHNNINAFADSYHDKDSVDIKDLCVIWGHKNLDNNHYHNLVYRSGSWTCYFSYKRGVKPPYIFDHHSLSNNHLLSDNPRVLNTIRRMRIGDQIHLKGMLVSYGETEVLRNCPKCRRNSSISREDSGNHACEVIFVTDAEILKHATPFWYLAHTWSWRLFFFLLVGKIVLFVLVTRRESKI